MVARANQYVHGIILAGVHLWDDNAFNSIAPRPLLPVGQRPLICHVLRWLRQGGIGNATICANSTSRLVRRYLGSGKHLNIDLDYYEDWTPRGPAGCVRDAALGKEADTYLVTDGTIIPQVDLSSLLEAHERSSAAVTVVVSAEAAEPGTQEHLVPAGIYVFDRKALDAIGHIGYQDIKEILLPRLHQAGHKVATYVAPQACPRVCGFSSYLAVNGWMVEQMGEESYTLLNYQKVGESQIHEDAHVDPTARLIGPVMIGPGTMVQPGATIVGPCVIGGDCLIESGAVVCRSVLWDRCQIGSEAVVDHCVLTRDAYVEEGTRLYNRVRTPTNRRGHLLQRLRFWKGSRAGTARYWPSRQTGAAKAGYRSQGTGDSRQRQQLQRQS